MDLQNPKPIVSQNKQNKKSSIEESEQKILKLKIQVMQIVCAAFYNNEHRCLLSYVAACTLRNETIKDDDLSIFQNYSSLIVDLKDGYFLSPYEIFQKRTQGKKQKKVICYKLDINSFFKLIGEILKDFQSKLKKIKEFYLQSERAQTKDGQSKKMYKRCKNCHTKQNVHVQLFGFDSCEKCKGNQFQDVVINDKQKIRIDKLNDIIMIVFSKLKEIKDLQLGLQSQIEQYEQKKQVKVNEIDHFMAPFLKILKEKEEQVTLQTNFRTIKEAEKLHAPLVEYERVKDMIKSREAREKRQRSRQINVNGGDLKKLKSL